MPKLVALKRLRYPRGTDGKEYNAGESFEVLSERDAKALTLVRAAKAATADPPVRVSEPRPVLRRAMEAAPPPSPPMTTESASEINPRGARYRRRDQQAED